MASYFYSLKCNLFLEMGIFGVLSRMQHFIAQCGRTLTANNDKTLVFITITVFSNARLSHSYIFSTSSRWLSRSVQQNCKHVRGQNGACVRRPTQQASKESE